jgi:propionyl-CoA carboxylase alpha chain
LGDKTAARKLAQSLGVPTVAGTTDALRSDKEAFKIAREIGYPLLLKAAAGGGGKGMRVVEDEQHLQSSLEAARSEAITAFGDSRVYIEKYIMSPRHIEVQILADRFGNVVYLGERECSIQRRHQKVIEETPSPVVDEDLRRQLGESAVRIARAAHYVNAGTLEFLIDEHRNYYFLEMNTRLQVEHPVTEMVTGFDLVREQIALAEGEPLHFKQTDIFPRGHAIECRICAEDPANDFFPSTGTLFRYRPPQGRIRVDNGYNEGDVISVFYDSLMAKVISHGTSRTDAISAMKRALGEFEIDGVETTLRFCEFVLDHPAFRKGEFDTTFIQSYLTPSSLQLHREEETVVAAIFGAYLATRDRVAAPLSNGSPVVGPKSNWKLMRKEGMQG